MDYGLRRCAGQALLELAVFGSMMIVVMGVLVSYGMNADRQQQAQMHAIRDGMWAGARSPLDNSPDVQTYINVDAGIVPDPTHPFAVGASALSSYSFSSPHRSFRVGASLGLNNAWELPRSILKINGQEVDCPSARIVSSVNPGLNLRGCTTAGFWNVFAVRGFKWEGERLINNPDTIQPIDKYDMIFGLSATRKFGPVVCNPYGNCYTNLQITDDNQGEIVFREGAIYTCRFVLDLEACRRECLRGRKDPDDPEHFQKCTQICAQPVMTPPYCQAGANPNYLSPQFMQLFAGIRTMGDQPNTTKVRELNTTMRRHEDAAGVANTFVIDGRTERTNRNFVFRNKNGSPFAVMGTQRSIPVTIDHVQKTVIINGKVHADQDASPGPAKTTIWETPHD